MHVGRSGPAGPVSAAYVELRLAGTFRVVRDGTELTDGEIGSRKSRTLLKLLAVERPGLVPVGRIVDVLWPNERPAAPEQNVATLVSRLRAVLGADLIQGGRAGYRLVAGPDVVVDLDAAAGFCEQAEGKLSTAAAVALAAAERAHELLSAGTAIGDEPYADWADPAREQMRELLRRVRLAAAEAALATGDPRRTAAYAEAAMAADPFDEAAAVLGATVDPLTLGVMLDLVPATALELCEAALAARLLVVSGRDYEFANDLIREVLYASTPEPTRLAHHRRAADLLTGQPESLARHAAAAGDWLRAARAWLRAGEDAMGRFAASDAAALATQALAAGERVADAEVSARALVLRGRALEAVGAHAAALADLTRGADGARAAGDRRLEMLALRELGGDVPVTLGLPVSYYAANLESGLRIAESLGDRASEANMLSRLAIIAGNRLRLDAALDYGLRAVAAGRAAADDQALAAGLDGLKFAYLSVGDTSALADVLAELGPLLRRLGDLFRLQWAEFEGAFLSIAAAEWDGAAAAIRAPVEVNHRGGYPQWVAWYVAHLGWLTRRWCAATVPGRSSCSSGAWPQGSRRGWRPTCYVPLLRWPPPLARRPCSARRPNCLRMPASRPGAPGCSGTRPTCRWHRRGWDTMTRNARERSWLRCLRWRSGSRGRSRWPKSSSSTATP